MPTLPNVYAPERGVILLDKDLNIIQANKRASEIFNIPIEQLIGSKLPSAVTHRSSDLTEVIEEVIEDSFGTNAIFHRYSTPVFKSGGEAIGRVEIYSNITARRELEKEILERNVELASLNRQLQEAQEQLVQSERLRALGEMAAGVAHDINNVLGIILGNAQLAKRKLDPDSPTMQCVMAIEMAAKDAADTVRRLREIGKPIDTAGYKIIDLSKIVEDVVKAAFPAWKESVVYEDTHIEVNTNLAEKCYVKGNPIELREALANILLNAAQAIDISGKIDISTTIDNMHVCLSVKDNGAGMNEETQTRLFDPFFTTRGAEGTGLGMSMVDAIAIRHRGKVIVESEQDQGTVITMQFPACLAAECDQLDSEE